MSFVQLNRLLCDILIFIILANYAESALPFFDDENPDLMMTTNVTAMDNADVDRDIVCAQFAANSNLISCFIVSDNPFTRVRI